MRDAAEAPLPFRTLIQRIATGPHLSKDLSREETRDGMAAILAGTVDPVQAAVFLIALRMKRETEAENLGVLDAVRDATRGITAPVDEVLDLSDPYDGFTRSLPVAPFLPALLAACGVPAVSHGVARAGPKYGATHRAVLAAAGVAVDLGPEQAAARLGDPRIGWAYVDQSAFCPSLHDLLDLRERIVKRPVLTTVEGLAKPVAGRRRTYLLRGYVHKAYPPVYEALARAAGFDAALVVRGVEGGVIPSLRQASVAHRFAPGGALEAVTVDPTALGPQGAVRAPAPAHAAQGDASALAAEAAAAGVAALGGAPGVARDALVLGAALALWHVGRAADPVAGAATARAVLDAGEALRRLEAGRS